MLRLNAQRYVTQTFLRDAGKAVIAVFPIFCVGATDYSLLQ